MSQVTYIVEPLTGEEFRGRCNTAGRINVNIGVEFNRLMAVGGDDMDGLNDLAEQMIVPKTYKGEDVGGLGLTDLGFKVAGAIPEKNVVVIEVDADANAVLDEMNQIDGGGD